MPLARPFRNTLCRFLAVALLWAQFAVAAYACPSPQAMVSMADCTHLSADSSQPGAGPSALCAEHCRQGQQSDQVHAPVLPAVVLTRLYTLPEPVEPHLPVQGKLAPDRAFVAASAPHTILHCRFRI